MSQSHGKEQGDDIPEPQRPPTPPIHTTLQVRGLPPPPRFEKFKPRDTRLPGHQGMTHVAWNCDGRRIGAVGLDRTARVWNPDKAMDGRTCLVFTYSSNDSDVDYIAWNPTHPDLFCTSSQKDRRIVFWDCRQSKAVQVCSLKVSPSQMNYSPDGKVLVYTSINHQLYFLTYEGKQWVSLEKPTFPASTAMFNYAGDGLVLTHHSEHTLRTLTWPDLIEIQKPAAHVGGCVAVALDPRGIYLASGGGDSIVNLFDLEEWICARTITTCDHAINAVGFSHDGEYIAIANTGNYIDICATETGIPVYRVPALCPSPTVSWHPSKYAILYCGQTKAREGSPPSAVVSTFGLD
ncbi:WD40 repeat-like protein [Fistulina hepatica ATCC 64428]|uniref:WD40 repeat-like protein n=1 Tax=Fistulina hepatica ATCC 64428 TaxID=1128425 RepID=A0A0D7A6F4_9AGAR|nr:WD40 repeat-like protein [Fistulina hepatica ATCC 64428]